MARDTKDRTEASDLGLDLSSGSTSPRARRPGDDGALSTWLVACLLLGARISQEIGASAFRTLDDDDTESADILLRDAPAACAP